MLLNAAHTPISSRIPTAWPRAPNSDRPDAKRLRRSRVLCTNVIITASGPLLLDAPARRSAPYRGANVAPQLEPLFKFFLRVPQNLPAPSKPAPRMLRRGKACGRICRVTTWNLFFSPPPKTARRNVHSFLGFSPSASGARAVFPPAGGFPARRGKVYGRNFRDLSSFFCYALLQYVLCF